MKVQPLLGTVRTHRRLIGWGLATLAAIAWLLIYKLGSLTGGLSSAELKTAVAPVGWHGIYQHPLDLPLQVVRSAVFFVFPDHGQTLTRVPNVVFGGLAIASFGALIRLWHGTRTAVLATMLFATSAWLLHVSRLASYDVLYLWALPMLLLSHFALKRYNQNILLWYFGIIVWGALLQIPGLVWLVIADIYLQRKLVLYGWRCHKAWWQRSLYVFSGIIWLPLLINDLMRSGELVRWLGLPAHFAGATIIVKQFVAVPVHLFIRGPQYPQLWLGRAPILDIFSLVVCGLGIYFYIVHRNATRSRHLGIFLALGFVLVGLGGPVGLSLLVPLLYMAIATGIAFLLHEWLQIFPLNPLARALGIGLVITAVLLSCLYNSRAYFVAWPHAATTKATFQYHRQP